jgi:predicted transcriptional regulator
MRICIQRSTGRLIEMQSLATPGTLTENARRAGYDEKDVDEHEATPEDVHRLLTADARRALRPTLNDIISVLSPDQRELLKQLVQRR